MNNNMNIIYLHTHDAGRYIQPYGFPVKTPNLIKFAKEGVLFRKAYSVSPTCGPSRSAMLSGQYPHEIGMFGLPGTKQGWTFDDYGKHLVHTLNETGYETVLAGCQHETGKSDGELHEDLGYNVILNSKDRVNRGWFYQETIDYVERYLAMEHDKPFFLSVGIDEPHRNNIGREEIGIGKEGARFTKTRYYDPDKLDYRYIAPPPFMPDIPEIRKDMASYHEGVKIMDEYIGRVLYAIEHYGYAKNSLVIITTDHGIEFPGAKKTLSDQGIGVMLMMRGPHGFEGGRVIESLVSQLDIYPTICELLSIDRKHWLRGKSIMPLINNQKQEIHDEIFGEQTWHGRNLEPLRCVITKRYKLIKRYHEKGPIMRVDGPSGEIAEKYGFYERTIGHTELFDLYLDPWEHCNRAEDPQYSSICKELEDKINIWMNETNDVFITEKFPQHGARYKL